MNEFDCLDCGAVIDAIDMPDLCPSCQSDQLVQTCPMCGSAIDPDTKVCPECREAVA